MGRPFKKGVRKIGKYYYFRHKINGKDVYKRLPDPADPAFGAAYDRQANPIVPIRPAPTARSLAALIIAYRGSADYRGIRRDATRRNYLRYLDLISQQHGHRSVDGVRPAHVYKMRDAFQETPGKANNWLTVFRLLMAYATRLDWRADNPAAGIKALALDEYEPWPAELLHAAMDAATPMTRLIIAVGLYTGQRNSDVIRMEYEWIEDGIFSFQQQKTGVDVSVPLHQGLLDELKKLPKRAPTLIYERTGRPFGTTGAIQSRIRDLMAMPSVRAVLNDLRARRVIGSKDRFVFHGLRKNACCYLLELGLSDTQVGSMLGMSPQMVRHYGKRARALMIARGAAESMASGKKW